MPSLVMRDGVISSTTVEIEKKFAQALRLVGEGGPPPLDIQAIHWLTCSDAALGIGGVPRGRARRFMVQPQRQLFHRYRSPGIRRCCSF